MIGQLDTVVRFHNLNRLPELKRCIFSLVGQTYRPLRIILTVQRFSEADITATRAALAPLLDDETEIELNIVNMTDETPEDGRSVLLNLGVQEATGRYLAFLDYDDTLYPEAYELLVGQLNKHQAVIAFASVHIVRMQVYERFFYDKEHAPPFVGATLRDLFRHNFCPLHSYVIDRSLVPTELLSFNPALTIEEDYDVLLRICARFASDFSLIGTKIGHYYHKDDGSNTVPDRSSRLDDDKSVYYKKVKAIIEHRRRTTVVSRPVRQHLGLPDSSQPMTIRDVVDRKL